MNNTVSKTFRHASNVISISDIVIPWTRTKKGDNDKNNKIRELIVCATVNKAVPDNFYTDEEYGSRWKTMRSSINTFLNEIGADPDNSTMELKGLLSGAVSFWTSNSRILRCSACTRCRVSLNAR